MFDKNRDREVQRLFSEFVRYRQSGETAEKAWSTVQGLSNNLNASAKKQLAVLIQTWEHRVGENFKPSGKDVHTTMTVLEPQARKSVIRPLPPRPTEGNVTRPLHPVELGVDEENPHFDEKMTLLIQLPDYTQPLEFVIPQRDEIVIGRSAPDSILLPDIDVTKLPGQVTGVSRVHAAIRRNKGSLVLTDLGSKNGTFINGQRLLPEEIRVLRDGDELRVAHLTMKIFFHNPA